MDARHARSSDPTIALTRAGYEVVAAHSGDAALAVLSTQHVDVMVIDLRIPDTTGMKNEVILQKGHRTCYENQLTDVGLKVVKVETPADLKQRNTHSRQRRHMLGRLLDIIEPNHSQIIRHA